MRLIWTCENIDLFRPFCSFLTSKGILFVQEEKTNTDWGSDAYGTRTFFLWIREEDQVEPALNYLKRYLEEPSDPEFTGLHKTAGSPPPAISTTAKYLEQKLHRPIREQAEHSQQAVTSIRLTTLFVLLCCALFLLELWSERDMWTDHHETEPSALILTPVSRVLLFDYPRSYELLDKVIALYGYQKATHPQDLPPPGLFLYNQYLKEPVWRGYYPQLVRWSQAELHLPITKNQIKIPLQESPPFEKIREGQIWRFISPIFLHHDVLHLFFNMIWLLLLGIQIEARISAWRYIVLILCCAAISNTAQYLMSGPNFIGFSGVICGMATFIRARQKKATWEGYTMSSTTFAFICFFIGTLALLSFAGFTVDVTKGISLPIAIANTAHIVGAVTGYVLGNLYFFSWEKKDNTKG